MFKILNRTVLSAVVVAAMSSAAFAQASHRSQQPVPSDASDYQALVPSQGNVPHQGWDSDPSAFPGETNESGYGRGSENPQLGG
jgi:hypothetical protein